MGLWPFSPKDFVYERQVTINRSQADVFAYLKSRDFNAHFMVNV